MVDKCPQKSLVNLGKFTKTKRYFGQNRAKEFLGRAAQRGSLKFQPVRLGTVRVFPSKVFHFSFSKPSNFQNFQFLGILKFLFFSKISFQSFFLSVSLFAPAVGFALWIRSPLMSSSLAILCTEIIPKMTTAQYVDEKRFCERKRNVIWHNDTHLYMKNTVLSGEARVQKMCEK